MALCVLHFSFTQITSILYGFRFLSHVKYYDFIREKKKNLNNNNNNNNNKNNKAILKIN